jgi:hypothetical protein
VGLEGELRLDLRLQGGRVVTAGIASTRPDVAAHLLQGRTREVIEAMVPRLFSVCVQSQAVAAALACAAAAGETAAAGALAQARAAVAAEIVRETACRVLLEAPRWLGEEPAPAAVVAARAALALRPGAVEARDRDAIAHAALGCSAAAWLGTDTPAALDRWISAGAGPAARIAAQLRDEDDAVADARPAPPLLPAGGHAAWAPAIAAAAAADPDYARQPTRQGDCAETGALARLQHDGLLAALLQRTPGRALARWVARLREMALLLQGQGDVVVGASAQDGLGLAWVENARGLLVHAVRLDARRASRYAIVAPTEWNFHPAGALSRSLAGSTAATLAALRQRAQCQLRSLDPCVACRIEFADA